MGVPRGTLTPREQEIVRLLDGGLTQKEAATALGRSIRTIESHVKNIRAKTGSRTTTAAVSRARTRAASGRAGSHPESPVRDFPE